VSKCSATCAATSCAATTCALTTCSAARAAWLRSFVLRWPQGRKSHPPSTHGFGTWMRVTNIIRRLCCQPPGSDDEKIGSGSGVGGGSEFRRRRDSGEAAGIRRRVHVLLVLATSRIAREKLLCEPFSPINLRLPPPASPPERRAPRRYLGVTSVAGIGHVCHGSGKVPSPRVQRRTRTRGASAAL
jgi:hypothetical protein